MAQQDPTQLHHTDHDGREVRPGFWNHAHLHEHPDGGGYHHQLFKDGPAHQHWHNRDQHSTLPDHHHSQPADHNQDDPDIGGVPI